MSFCFQCGQELTRSTPPGDDRIRLWCQSCGWVNYQNPKVQVGLVAVWNKKILWMKRACEPRKGYWALPAGFMELDESLREAAAREAREETGIRLSVDDLKLYAVGTIDFINEVHVIFRADIDNPEIEAGEEALEVAWFAEHELPWEELAFTGVEPTTQMFYREVASGEYGIHYGEYTRENYATRNVVAELLKGR